MDFGRGGVSPLLSSPHRFPPMPAGHLNHFFQFIEKKKSYIYPTHIMYCIYNKTAHSVLFNVTMIFGQYYKQYNLLLVGIWEFL